MGDTAVGGEGDAAIRHRVEEPYGLHEALLLADGLENGEEAGEDLGGCKACTVVRVSRLAVRGDQWWF